MLKKKQARGGRKTDTLVNELVVPASTDPKERNKKQNCRFCKHSFAARDRKRHLKHAFGECKKIPPELRHRVSVELASMAPNAIVTSSLISEASRAMSKGAKQSVVTTGRKGDKYVSHGDDEVIIVGENAAFNFDSLPMPTKSIDWFIEAKKAGGQQASGKQLQFLLILLITCQALPVRFLDNVYTKFVFEHLCPKFKLPSSTKWADSIIPAEAASIKLQMQDLFSKSFNLTLSFDGWSSRSQESVYTITVTTMNRISYLYWFHSATLESHTGQYIADFLMQAMKEIGPERFAAVTSDNTGNTRVARRTICDEYPHILNLPDPCHHLHNALADIVTKIPEPNTVSHFLAFLINLTDLDSSSN